MLWACVICVFIAAGCRRRPIETTPGIDSPKQTWVRVLLFGNLRKCTVASTSGFTVEDMNNGAVADFLSNEPVDILNTDGTVTIGEHQFGGFVIIRPHEPYVFNINGDAYRGHLYIRANDDGYLETVNHVPLESYLLGVIGAEMQSYWETEALKVQAIASRTYCLYIKNRFGRQRSWDLTRSESSQVYRGLSAESVPVTQAVRETAGQVLVYPNSDSGRDVLFATYYSSSCGGHTEPANHIFGGESITPLSGVQCRYCSKIARHSHFYWDPVKLTIEQISHKLLGRYDSLAELESIVDFEITKLGYKSRIIQVRLIGKNGKSKTLRGEDFRLSLDPTGRKIRSAIFTVEKNNGIVSFRNGLGFGHGAGLCQCGVQGMARAGNDFKTILDHYFPNSKRVTIDTSFEP